jgi:regulator of protease activity HflC (stomatin/prohibitin superfamily)
VNRNILKTLLIGSLVFTGACTRIGPGHVGIVVNQAGTNRGVEAYPAITGWKFYNPMTTSILEYPTFVQTVVWSKSEDEGHPRNEELSFSTSEGTSIFADVALSYELSPDLVPHFYVKFRNDDLTLFTHGFLRNATRNAFNDVAGQFTVEQIYGVGKEKMLTAVKTALVAALSPYGVVIDQIGFTSNLRLPPNIVESINNKIKATQDAITSQNQLQITQAEAAKTVAEAEGNAKARIASADGEAKAQILLKASVTPEILELKRLDIQRVAADRWNGQLPSTMMGGNSVPFINLPK